MGFKKIVAFAMGIFFSATSYSQPAKETSWFTNLRKKIEVLEKQNKSQIGIFVRKISDKSEFEYNGDNLWYIASGVKLPVAIEVLRQIDQKKFTLDTKITLTAEDYVDGAGSTNFRKVGSQLTVVELLEQMMIYSDNTATDLLIKQVGLESVNIYLQEIVPSGFEKITTLADVRRRAYGQVHPSAQKLSSGDLLMLKKIPNETQRFKKLQEILNLEDQDLQCQNLGEAYNRYYSQNLNSATLRSYANLLQQVISLDVLSQKSRNLLIEIMSKTETGSNRIRRGLPKDVLWAHKTGTQRLRICDFGVAWRAKEERAKKGVLIAMCVKDFKSLAAAEKSMKQAAEVLAQSGVFE